ncbi:uncharacterized protein LOC108679614 [Hyalella azteca]|uniref:Uncharacterized protein LOC108679614 n=1 Tax=Hyalella azteca TaxID=294128 RepID=A0A8B7PCD9_HYAAZ|nr:uncharacterized protein LOC108679614 [Hyalella azteca]
MAFEWRASMAEVVKGLLLLLLAQQSAAWIPFIGEESHKHLHPTTQQGEWDLLQLVSLNESQEGVSLSATPHRNASAFVIKEAYTNGRVGHDITHEIFSHLLSDVSCFFVYRQVNGTVAPLITATMPGSSKPWLQINSDLRRRRLQLIYRLKGDRRTHRTTFPLSDKVGLTWTRLLVSISGTQVKVWVNCDGVVKRQLDGAVDLLLPQEGLLFFSHEQHFKNRLLGAVQTAKLFNFAMSSRVWRCNFDDQFGPDWKPPLIG